MSEPQCADDCAADEDLRAIVANHDRQIIELTDDVAALKTGQDAAMERLISIDVQGQERERNRSAEARETRNAITSLTRQLAEQTGAQKRQNELKEQELLNARLRSERVKYWATVIGIVAALGGMIGGTILSSQTWDDYFFANVPFLHHHVGTTP